MAANKHPNFDELFISAGMVFHPNTPVTERELFSGRLQQIRRVADVIFQMGQHAIIFGERGVGKTSLANVLQSFLPTTNNKSLLVTRINCDSSDTFLSVWKKIFDGVQISQVRPSMGFKSKPQQQLFSPSDFLSDNTNIPYQVLRTLTALSDAWLPVIIIDEFDRLTKSAKTLFADFVKSLSDHALSSTVILIGVGSSIEQLINEHQSVSRSLVQVKMPRMDLKEVEGIIISGLTKLGMDIHPPTLMRMKNLAKGLPYYAHLIALNACRSALDRESLTIEPDDYKNAIAASIEDAQHYVITQYHKAIRTAQKDTLFSDVLLACAYADVNELGEFAANDIKIPIKKITGKNYEIPAFARHLNNFCEEDRGSILIKSGSRRMYRYKFADPLMQPYIMMQGIINNISPEEITTHFSS